MDDFMIQVSAMQFAQLVMERISQEARVKDAMDEILPMRSNLRDAEQEIRDLRNELMDKNAKGNAIFITGCAACGKNHIVIPLLMPKPEVIKGHQCSHYFTCLNTRANVYIECFQAVRND